MWGSAGQEHATTAASAAIWRGNPRRRDRPHAGAVTAAARRDISRGSAQHSKEGIRDGRNPNSREDKLQGQEPNQSRGLSRSEE
ncbi:hypothetical protein DY000_02011921 [Brassica cretica]|uniref:Uncharacterized protein n=1 Tax=Brassica cretica TaxID=69181 RepID=A0ABQ7DAD4_BRACR|nr:hypothetical protein DY000_02011921 [Brassica cretica]